MQFLQVILLTVMNVNTPNDYIMFKIILSTPSYSVLHYLSF